eukprot:gb/GECG01005096.1/.p1 GENE.gb/GECG01005096.1/~~gb/GECG01005096.1/.p1  ORF type:complete len:1572 (+),score=266.02 gb/GECG01005096.1/:1-4716(+)
MLSSAGLFRCTVHSFMPSDFEESYGCMIHPVLLIPLTVNVQRDGSLAALTMSTQNQRQQLTVPKADPEKDHEGLQENQKFQKMLKDFKANPDNFKCLDGVDPTHLDEPVLFSRKLLKINRKGKKQPRIIAVTLLAVYNLKPGKMNTFQRRIGIYDLDRLVQIENSYDVLVHPWEQSVEYDYRLDCGDEDTRRDFVEACYNAYRMTTGMELTSVTLSEEFATSIAITKKDAKEKEKNQTSATEAVAQRKYESVARNLAMLTGQQPDGRTQSGAGKKGSATRKSSRRLSSIHGTPLSAKTNKFSQMGSSRRLLSSNQNQPQEEESDEQDEINKENVGADLEFGVAFKDGNEDKLDAIKKGVVKTIKAAHNQVKGNKTLAEVCTSWTMDSFRNVAELLAECVIHPDMAESVFNFIAQSNNQSHAILDGASHMSVDPREEYVRGLGTRALWKTCNYLRQKDMLTKRLDLAEGFPGYILTSFDMPHGAPSVKEFAPQVYYALLEILLNDIAKPSDKRGPIEPFGRPVACPTVLPLIMRLLPAAPWTLKRDVMKDMNVLLVKREENFEHILMQRDWMSWMAPLLATCPKKSSDRTEEQNEFLKYTMNMFAMVLNFAFSKGENKGMPIDELVERLLTQLAVQCGWNTATVSVSRSLLTNLVVKIGNGMKRWSSDPDRPEWRSLLKLCVVIENFFFYRPVSDEDTSHLLSEASEEKQSILTLPPELQNVTAEQPVVENADDHSANRKKDVGMHLNVTNGEPEDVKLAQRILNLLQKLGFTGDSNTSTALAMSKSRSAKEVISNGNILAQAYGDIVRFFEECSQLAAEKNDDQQQTKLIERLGKFLEKRQKAAGVGFFGKSSTSKKQIVHSLKVSLMKQQAQQTIRSQVRSKMATAKAPVTIKEDAAQEEEGAQGVTAKRLRGAKAGDSKEDAQTAMNASLGAMEGGEGESAEGKGEEGEGVSNDTRCAKCEQPLLDDDGVEALGQHWHVQCFTCAVCGNPFHDNPYFERKGKAYCKTHYLEKFGRSVCGGCLKPFKRGDSAMEAAEKLWHPECFKCTHCTRLFEPEEVFYEKDGLPYCDACNEALFVTCPTCQLPVEDQHDGIAALDKNWHAECFRCTYCDSMFHDNVYYAKTDPATGDRKPYCDRCYTDLFVPKCRLCEQPVKDQGLFACGSSWHQECFVCTECEKPFENLEYFEMNGLPYCSDDYWNIFGKKCASCGEIVKGEEFNALEKTYHPQCFTCADCGEPFEELQFYVHDGKPYKKEHFMKNFCSKCPNCNEYVLEDAVEALDETWHADCLRDAHTGEKLTDSVIKGPDGKIYSKATYQKLFAETCTWCGESISEKVVTALEKKWHAACLVCADPDCQKQLLEQEEGFNAIDGVQYCMAHFIERKGPGCQRCGEVIRPDQAMKLMDMVFHSDCLRCFATGSKFDASAKIFAIHGMPVSEEAFKQTLDVCGFCRGAIMGEFLSVEQHKFHKDCLRCMASGEAFSEEMYLRDGWPVSGEYADPSVDLPDEGLERMRLGTEAESSVPEKKEEVKNKVAEQKQYAQQRLEENKKHLEEKQERQKRLERCYGGYKEE